MSKKFIRFVAVLTILVSIVGNTGVVRADPVGEKTSAAASASPATAPWFVGWADKTTSANVGSYPSIAYSPIDGLPYISYYDATNHHLMLASPVWNGGSNCGVGGNWWCRVVDGDGSNGSSTDSVGLYSSIAFWKNPSLGGGWKVGIAYYDSTNKALKYAVYSKALLISGTWSFVTISSGSIFYDPGTYTSLKFNSDGEVRIAYYAYSSLVNTGYLKLATPVASGGNCGIGTSSGKWQCDTVDSGAGVGKYAALDLNYDDQVFLAYYDEGNGNLKYAYYGGIGFCGTENAWICSTVDSAGIVGLSAALTAPRSSTDHVRIAYYDKTNGKLKYATPSSGGNCGGGAWQCLNVDSMGAGIPRAGISMALDKNGNPIIAYMEASQDQAPSTLKIARPVDAVGLFTGNCGDVPPGYLFEVWQCYTVDNAAYGQGNVNVAAYTSVAISPTTGLGTIAYFEEDGYNYTTSLKVAYQRLQIFLPLIER